MIKKEKVSVGILMKKDYDPTQMSVDKTESSNEGQKPVRPVISGRKVNHSKTKISELKGKDVNRIVSSGGNWRCTWVGIDPERAKALQQL